MNNAIFPAVLAGLFAGLTGSAAVAFFSQPDRAAGHGNAGDDQLASELSSMRSSHAELLDRIASLEARSTTLVPAATREAASSEEDLAFEAQLHELVERMTAAPETPVNDGALYSNVSQALLDIRAQEDEERRLAAEQARADRLEERLGSMAEELNLEGYQLDQMRTLFTEQGALMEQTFAEIRETNDWGSMRDTMTELRLTAEESVKGILSEEQYAAYEESRYSRSLMPMGGSSWSGRGGGGRGGGRGGGQ